MSAAKVGHYKPDCPNLKRKEKESSSNKRRSKGKKAYVAWESSISSSHSSSSSSSSDERKVANVCFTTHHHKKKDKAPKKVNQNPSSSYTSLEYHDLQSAFEDLCSETRKAFKRLKEIIKVNKTLEKKVSKTEEELKAFKEKCLDSLERRWFLDSGCSRHMTGDASLFTEFKAKKKGYVTYGDNNKGTILGVGVDTNDILKDQEVVGSDQPSTEVPKEKDDKPSPSNEDKDDGGSSSSKNHHKQRGVGLAKE
ncbi:hypothetical protein QL285_045347 [Trifolium repens]|nr:hypothetical protein QL285_045347 [Trifolium repens]